MIGSAVAVGLAVGMWFLVVGLQQSRVPTVEQRVVPYLRDVLPSRPVAPGISGSIRRTALGAAQRLGEWIGSTATIRRRLERLGAEIDVETFRGRQAWASLIGFIITFALALVLWQLTHGHVVGLVMFCVLGAVGGAWWVDQELARQVKEHEARMREEFPAVAEMIALAVAAGESPVAAIERVSVLSDGAMSREFDRILADVRSGVSIVVALEELAARTGVQPVARFADGLAVAIERGTPLVDVLHAQAADVRESGRRELIESAGRREIAMMIPVVFGQLPVVLIFAFYPGLVALNLTSGS